MAVSMKPKGKDRANELFYRDFVAPMDHVRWQEAELEE